MIDQHVIRPTSKPKYLCASELHASVDPTAVEPDLALVSLFQVKVPHSEHPLLEIEKEHGLVHGKTINNHPGLRRVVKGLIRCQNPLRAL